jgi:hypothetical protein
VGRKGDREKSRRRERGRGGGERERFDGGEGGDEKEARGREGDVVKKVSWWGSETKSNERVHSIDNFQNDGRQGSFCHVGRGLGEVANGGCEAGGEVVWQKQKVVLRWGVGWDGAVA